MSTLTFRNRNIKLSTILLIGAVSISSVGCVAPKFSEPVPDPHWNTEYQGALSPHTQLALGVMKIAQEHPERINNKVILRNHWEKLAKSIESGESDTHIKELRRQIETSLGSRTVEEIKGKQYQQADLMSFMLSTGMSIPRGGPGSINPDLMAANKVQNWLSGDAQAEAAARFSYTPVDPSEALSPVENLTLGTVTLLAEERDSFDMSQIFRLALYFRPLRRLYDPNPDLVKNEGKNIETVYMDRIWRVLSPEQVMKIRERNLTRTDMKSYIDAHNKLPMLDPDKLPVFTLLEYAVNDFHEQIAPQNTIRPEEKGDFFIPATLKKLSGKNTGDGKQLFEGICASCHGVDGQGRFPPITVQSYLKLHSDIEHAAIVMEGPPQKPGSPVVMPTFHDKLTQDQIWAIVKYLRSFERQNVTGKANRRGETEARQAGVLFYDTVEIFDSWKNGGTGDRLFLDIQSDIAFRIMGHIDGSTHIRPEELFQNIDTLPKDKEIIVIDMFGSQGLDPARRLAEAGYRVGYMSPGMMDWHIVRNFPVAYN